MATDWVQLGCNAGRTAWTDDEPRGPFEVAWVYDGVYPEDRVTNTAQVVTWEGRGFVGSKRGRLYAFRLSDGSPCWRFDAGRAIEQAAACLAGRVIFGSMDGAVYAVYAETGRLAWRTDLGARGITNAPLLDEGRVYIGTRGGTLACLAGDSGAVLWRQDLGWPVLQSPAGGDGKVFVAPEDRRMRAYDARTGRPLWTSDYRAVLSTLRGTHPVYHGGMVLMGGFSRFSAGWYRQGENPFVPLPQDVPAPNRATDGFLEAADFHPSYRRWLADYADYLSRHPVQTTLIAYDAETGRLRPSFPSVGQQSMTCPVPPPAVTPGGLVVHPQLYGHWAAQLGLFDAATRELRRVIVSLADINNDETQNFSGGGSMLFTFHMWESHPGVVEAYDLRACRRESLPRAYPWTGWEWKAAPPGNAATICGDLLMHVGAHRVAAWRGTGKAPREDAP